MNASSTPVKARKANLNRDPKTGRYVRVLLVVTNSNDPVMPMRGPDYYDDDGKAVWIGPRAAVEVPTDDGDAVARVREILGAPRLVEFLTAQKAKGFMRVPVSHYGAEVHQFPSLDTDDDVPTAQDSWVLLAEAVGL